MHPDRGHRTLFISRKGNKTATIPLSPRTGRAIDLYLGERDCGPIFLNHDCTRRLNRHAAARIVRRLAKRAGIDKRISPHIADLAGVLPMEMPLVGHSWGAMLALSFAVAHPELVTSLVLVGCGTYSVEGRRTFHRLMEQRLGDEGRARIIELDRAQARAESTEERDRIFTELGDYSVQVQGHDPLPDPSDLPADPVGHRQTWDDVMRRQRDGIEPAAFAAITAPVTMLHGDDDPHVGSIIRATLVEHVPHLRYVELSRCGHTPWIERHAAEPFLAALREALDPM